MPGKTYYDLMHALRELGLDGNGLERAGIRILKLGMISPLEPEIAREFARGLDEVLVAEEKGPFVETLLKDALYGMADAPRILGKRDERGEPLLPRELDLDADLIGRALAARLEARGVQDRARSRRACGSSPRSTAGRRSCRWRSAPRSSAPAARTTAP